MSETREVSVPVTAAHIERGQDQANQGSLRSKTCAVALALTDALGYPCSCGTVSIIVAGPVRVVKNDGRQLPDSATRFLMEADRQYERAMAGLAPDMPPLEPFTFTITVADSEPA